MEHKSGYLELTWISKIKIHTASCCQIRHTTGTTKLYKMNCIYYYDNNNRNIKDLTISNSRFYRFRHFVIYYTSQFMTCVS